MKFRRVFLSLIFGFPLICSAVNKDILELQREIGQLQDQMRALQSTLDQRLATLATLVQQSFDASNRANTSVASLEGGIRETMRVQGDKVVAPVANVGAKIDQMTTEFQAVKDNVADMTSRMGKLEQQMLDISNALKNLSTPAAPPPGALPSSSLTSPATSPSGSTTVQSGPNGPSFASGGPGVPPPADTLYQNAYRDKSGGKTEMALQEFGDYLKYYPSMPYAPNAQYQIGDIYFNEGNYDAALKAFDLVLEKFPENNKTPDALYMKGLTLVRMRRPTAGSKEFQEVLKRYPRSEMATKAREQLRLMGLPAGGSTGAVRRKR